MRKRRITDPPEAAAQVADGFCEWIASLPFVRQRCDALSPTTRMFDIDCDPLERHVTWLVVDHAATSTVPTRITALLPRRAARRARRSRLGVRVTAVVPDRVLFSVDPLARPREVEALVLEAYCAALS
jgi:hypothetical protein